MNSLIYQSINQSRNKETEIHRQTDNLAISMRSVSFMIASPSVTPPLEGSRSVEEEEDEPMPRPRVGRGRHRDDQVDFTVNQPKRLNTFAPDE